MKEQMRIYYDEEGDYLTVFTGISKPNYGEEIANGITIFRDQETDQIVGIGILDFRKKAKNLNELELKLPFKISFSDLRV